MSTFRQLASKPDTIPAATAWYLADLGEARGRQELFSRQVPQRLKALREHAIVESAVSSNRIEGVEVENDRVAAVVLGNAHLRDRNEEELRGYRDALSLIHRTGAALPVSEATILDLHRLTRGEIWDAGRYKDKESDIIERYPDGRWRVRFMTVPAASTPDAMKELVASWETCIAERWTHPLIALAAFNLDFLCIHPFRDGNGRVSRLLWLLQTTHLGYEVGRYISLERLVEQNKERYYETLEQSSAGWHDESHDPWPYVNFVLFILKTACREFEARVGQVGSPRGSKTTLIAAAIGNLPGQFTLRELEQACPSVSRDMIRRVVREMAGKGKLVSNGRGPGARWVKEGNVEK